MSGIEQRGSVTSVIERFERLRSLTVSLAVLVTGTVLLVALGLELTIHRVVLEPFQVSADADLLNAGAANIALAQRYAGELRDIVAEAQSNYPAELADVNTGRNRFEPPGELQTFTAAVRFIAEALGTRVTHIEGVVITHADGSLTLSVRVRSPKRGRDVSVTETGLATNIEDLLQRSSINAMAEISPVTAAVYMHGRGKPPADVISVAQRMLKSGPSADYAWAYTLWAFAKLSADQPESAVSLLNQALAYDPEFTLAHYNLGTAFQAIAGKQAAAKDAGAAANYQRATREYALSADSRSDALRARSFLNQALCLKALNRRFDALVAVRSAIDAHNYFPTAFWLQGQILMELGRVDEGQRWYERTVAETYLPQEANDACVDLGNALWRAGRARNAVATFDKCLTLPLDDQNRADVESAIDQLNKKEGA
jgi:tetratricopeptide (TPR) repeat protein